MASQLAQVARRAFWSGTIAFGLVSLPVHLFTANRSNRASLRMLSKDGRPLARRYFCSKEDVVLKPDELIRGYEVETDKYVEVSDDELSGLQPDKSREIDLRRFVPLDELDPTLFQRAYFLIPNEGAIKAYRLLAQTMESVKRAGIATVVMRGKEYLIAIIAKNGILRAETLRFSDELRTAEELGLNDLEQPTAAQVKKVSSAIKKLSRKTLKDEFLHDGATARILALVEQKLDAGDDVLHPEEDETEANDDNVIDLMEVLKQSLKGK